MTTLLNFIDKLKVLKVCIIHVCEKPQAKYHRNVFLSLLYLSLGCIERSLLELLIYWLSFEVIFTDTKKNACFFFYGFCLMLTLMFLLFLNYLLGQKPILSY